MSAKNNSNSTPTLSTAAQSEKIALPDTQRTFPLQGYQNTSSKENTPSSINTEEENISILNAKLEQSMTAFDNMLASENIITETEEDAMSSNALSDILNNNNSGSTKETTSSSSNRASEGSPGTEASNEGKNGSENSGADNNSNTRYQASIPGQGSLPSGRPDIAIPADVTDGASDDIVARQIREAAIKEKDPTLQNKLWAEYRKYKQGN